MPERRSGAAGGNEKVNRMVDDGKEVPLKEARVDRELLTRLFRKCFAIFAVMLTSIALTVDRTVKCASEPPEVVFISPTVVRTELIVDDLPWHADVVYLPEGDDAIGRITQYLARRRDINTVRIITHGGPGHLFLNGETVDEAWLRRRRERIESWGKALSQDADILLYACRTAENPEGRRLVRTLAEFTGADVAASTKALGGEENNWILDYRRGDIETPPIAVDGYPDHLETYTVTKITDDGTGDLGTLSRAINQSNGTTDVDDTIVFYLDSGNTVTLSAEPPAILALPAITDSVTLDGTNLASLTGSDVTVQVTIPGTSPYRVFNINASNETVTIKNMTIQGGDISGDLNGGGINITAGTVDLDECIVSGSKALYGGGICNYDGTLTISNSTISGNTAARSGGGIESVSYYGTATVTITNSTISGNTATFYGGGIESYAYYGTATATITNSTISGNTAQNRSGGGIESYAYYGTATATITDSIISGNTAARSGGGISNRGYDGNTPTATITDSTIRDNEVTNYGGGGIYNYDGTLTISNSTISGNTAARSGGGIFNYSYYSGSPTVTITNSTISGNTAARSGGGIFNYSYYSGSPTVTITNSTISGNTAQNRDGGGISSYNYDDDYNATATITNSTISGNTAARDGGAIDAGNYGDVTIENSTIANNHSDNDNSGDGHGGGISLYLCDLNVKNTIVANNIKGNEASTTADDYFRHSGTLTDNGYNAIGVTDTVGWSATGDWNDTDGDGTFTQVGTGLTGTLNLSETLADNGGPTQTLAITSYSSIAVGNGNTTETYDQRGVPRKNPPTIGAYEYLPVYRTDGGAGTSWSNEANWEFFDGSSWIGASEYPDADNSESINVRRDMNVDTNVSIDQTTVDPGATLTVDADKTLTVENFNGGDLTANGNINIASSGTLSINSGAAVNVAGNWTNWGTFTAGDGTVTFTGSEDSTLSGNSQNEFHNLTLNKDAPEGRLVFTSGNTVTVQNDMAITRGTLDLGACPHNLLLGGGLTIGTDGRWTQHGSSTPYVEFYGTDCTFSDGSTGGPQNLGHVKVDD
jgi:uncharacterized protein DUF4347/polymorphic membrane protein